MSFGSLDDTDADLRARQDAVYARMTPTERLGVVARLNAMTDGLALAGLRAMHPRAGENELRMRLLVRKHGAELVRDAYGWSLPVRD